MLSYFFFNDPATTEIYTLSLHDALPISAMKETKVMMPVESLNRFRTLAICSSTTITAMAIAHTANNRPARFGRDGSAVFCTGNIGLCIVRDSEVQRFRGSKGERFKGSEVQRVRGS